MKAASMASIVAGSVTGRDMGSILPSDYLSDPRQNGCSMRTMTGRVSRRFRRSLPERGLVLAEMSTDAARTIGVGR